MTVLDEWLEAERERDNINNRIPATLRPRFDPARRACTPSRGAPPRRAAPGSAPAARMNYCELFTVTLSLSDGKSRE